jgi:hypothetical protein
MKTAIFTLITLILALASVVMSEVINMLWLQHVPFDATGNFFWSAVLPVQLIVVGITTALLIRVYAHKPAIFMPLYAIVYIVAHAAELNAFFNPLADILAYVGMILIALGCWYLTLWRWYLSRSRHQVA